MPMSSLQRFETPSLPRRLDVWITLTNVRMVPADAMWRRAKNIAAPIAETPASSPKTRVAADTAAACNPDLSRMWTNR